MQEPDVKPDRARPRWGRALLCAFLLAVIGAAVIGGATYWWLNRGLVSTDDAFIDGNTVSLSPQVGGKVLRLLIDDNQRVKAGDLLLEIDPRDYEAARDSAKANLDRALAAEVEASSNLDLTRATTTANIASAEAGLAQAKAALAQAAAQLQSSTAEAERAAAALKLTAEDLQSFGLIDGIVAEPPGGAHENMDAAAECLRQALRRYLDELSFHGPEELVKQRYTKFRTMGNFFA